MSVVCVCLVCVCVVWCVCVVCVCMYVCGVCVCVESPVVTVHHQQFVLVFWLIIAKLKLVLKQTAVRLREITLVTSRCIHVQISENMTDRQGTVSLQDVLTQVFRDEDSACEADD